jgi:hypothetical protein
VIGKALELDAAYREIDGLRARLATELGVPEVIGRSPAMERLLGQVRQVAGLDTTVLLEGESGTGKELVARLLHAWSVRARETLPRSQLRRIAGNAAGKPAVRLRERARSPGPGRPVPATSKEAHGGNLFLDEIADMSPKLQSSLLARVAGPPIHADRQHPGTPRRFPPDLRHQPRSWPAKSRPAASAKTCTTGSTSSRCVSCRPCASAPATSSAGRAFPRSLQRPSSARPAGR